MQFHYAEKTPDVSTRAAVLRISLDLDGNRAEAQNSPHAVVR